MQVRFSAADSAPPKLPVRLISDLHRRASKGIVFAQQQRELHALARRLMLRHEISVHDLIVVPLLRSFQGFCTPSVFSQKTLSVAEAGIESGVVIVAP